MMKALLILIMSFCNLTFCKAEDRVLQRLDECLEVSSKYDAVKQTEIKKLHQKANIVKRPSERYKAYIHL